jgi:aspartate oxidase
MRALLDGEPELDGAPVGDWAPARLLPRNPGGPARAARGGLGAAVPPGVSPEIEPANGPKSRERLQRAMTDGAGVLRDAPSLARAAEAVAALASGLSAPGDRDPDGWELANLVSVAGALLAAATTRTESRGAHTRADFPLTDPGQRVRLVHGRAEGR